jgi:hypothetical protein
LNAAAAPPIKAPKSIARAEFQGLVSDCRMAGKFTPPREDRRVGQAAFLWRAMS